MLTIEEKGRRIEALSVSERRAEEVRQGEELCELIEALVREHGQATELPMLNAVFMALLAVEARMLATLEPAQRRAMIKSCEKTRPAYLGAALAGNPDRVRTVKVRRADA